MQQADVRVGTLYPLAGHLPDETKHAVRRRMRRPEIQGVWLDVVLFSHDVHALPAVWAAPARAPAWSPCSACSSPGSRSGVMPSQGDMKSKVRTSWVSRTGA